MPSTGSRHEQSHKRLFKLTVYRLVGDMLCPDCAWITSEPEVENPSEIIRQSQLHRTA